jgi:hypothetical protein
MPRLNLNICLTDIPKELIRRAGNGKCYINLNVSELREADERGNDHTVSVFIPQDRREDYPDKIYIGRGKHYPDPGVRTTPASQPASDNLDLPF